MVSFEISLDQAAWTEVLDRRSYIAFDILEAW